MAPGHGAKIGISARFKVTGTNWRRTNASFSGSVYFDDGASKSTISLIYDSRELKYTYITIWQRFYKILCKYPYTLDFDWPHHYHKLVFILEIMHFKCVNPL